MADDAFDSGDLELFERSIRSATERHDGSDLDGALAELGFADALAADPRAAISTVFTALGSDDRSCAALDTVLADRLVPPGDGLVVVLPPLGSTEPPGSHHAGRLDVRGLCFDGDGRAGDVMVVARSGTALVTARSSAGALDRRPISGIDPSLGLAEISGSVDATTDPCPSDHWTAARVHGQLALAHQLVGASRRMLELAREHALDRVQFGQPIARFQAVRHRLAETLVAIETAEAAVAAAWADGTSDSAAIAKALAGRGARTAAGHCQQVLAGVGFTAEHPLHSFVRRILVLEQLLGSTRQLTDDLGRQVLATRRLPTLLPL